MRKQKLIKILRKSYDMAVKVCGFESAEAETLKKRLIAVLSEGVLLKEQSSKLFLYSPEKASSNHRRFASQHHSFLSAAEEESSYLQGNQTVELLER